MPLAHPPRLPSQAGIAIGPILFLLAILAVIAIAMSSGIGQFGAASVTDRIASETQSQANLIRAKINECNLVNGTNNNYDGYPPSDVDKGTPVSQMECDGDAQGAQNIWTGSRPSQLPPPTNGFNNWMYLNSNGSGFGGTAANGRCIWIEPLGNDTAANSGLVDGLKKAASKFTNSPKNDGASEVNYDPNSPRQRFILWITLPASVGSEAPNCKPQ